MALNPKQQRFVDEYLVDLNATQAAIRAGYSRKTAGSVGFENLQKPEIASAIQAGREKLAEQVQFAAADVLRHWIDIATADPNDLIQYRRLACRDCKTEVALGAEREPDRACTTCGGRGEGRVHVEDSRKLKGRARRLYAGVKLGKDGLQVLMRDQDAALVNIAKHLGMFVDKQQITGPGGGPLQHVAMTQAEFEQVARSVAAEI